MSLRTARTESATVNGIAWPIADFEERSLLWVLRDDFHLTGAKPGCGEGACGACTVLLDGEPVHACVTPALDARGKTVTTVEGLARGGALHPVQEAMASEGAVQCGYCTSGMVLSAAALLARDPDPDRAAIREAMAGNVCRCCGYVRIERAIRRAAAELRGETGPNGASDDGGARELPGTASFSNFAPRAPWDLSQPADREYFELLGDGLVVVLEPQPPAPGPLRMPGGGAWLHYAVDGTVTAFAGKVDVGQDNRTALALIVADELAVEPAAVRLALGDTDLCPFDIGTFGSRSLPGAGEDLCRCAAHAREWIAAHEPPEPGARVLELASRAAARPLDRSRWRYRGRPFARVTARELVTGRHVFPSDLARPGMLHGRVLRPPARGAVLDAVDVGRAQQMPGVTVVHDNQFVGVAASDARTAGRALAAIEATWAGCEQPAESELETYLRSHPIEGVGWEGPVREEHGDLEAALVRSDVQLAATYTTAYLAHVPLETRVAIAEWEDGRLTVWTGTQQPFLVRAHLATELEVAEERVRVIVPDFGGGFGSKHTEAEALAAARLARATGRPVKVAFSREEEFRYSYLRPAAVIDIRGGAAANGALTAWEHINTNSGAAALRTPYTIADQRVVFQPAKSPLAQGPYRALAATANHFARESQIDELAHAVGIDPLQFRLHNLDDDRLKAVLLAVADRAGWHQRSGDASSGSGAGLACGMEKGGRVATCAHVRVHDRQLEILRIVTAYECGALINPDNVRRQIEGATVMGLGGALFEAVHFDSGRIVNASLRSYRVPRCTDVPAIEAVLLDRPDLPPAGAGETPIVAIAPALANAIFAAAGVRLRSLPLLGDRTLSEPFLLGERR